MRRLERVLTLIIILALPLCAARAESGGPPAFTLTRVLSSEYAAAGDWITLSYTARNNSQYPITSLTISDALVGDVAQVDRLEAGESETFVARARIEKDSESQPAARFALGGNMHTVWIAPVSIRVETIALTASLAFDVKAVRLTVTNGGNAPVYNVKAFDDALGDMGEAVERLDPGATAFFRRPADGGRHQASVTAVSAAGQALSVRSNEIVGTPFMRPVLEEPAWLSVQRDEDGRVWLTLFNPGPDTWRDVRLLERGAGVEQTLRFVPAGEQTWVLWESPAGDAGPFAFEAALPDGLTLKTNLEARHTDGQAEDRADAAEARGVQAPGERSFRMDENPQTYRQMLRVTAALMGLFLIGWWISYHRRKRLARKKRLRQRQESRKRQQNKKNGEKAS